MRQRPCQCRRARSGAYTADQCYKCWLALNVAAYAALWGEPAPVDPREPVTRTEFPSPCRWLGPVVEPATCGCGAKSVLMCLCDQAPWDLCTLGPNARPGEVGNCSDCRFREPLAVSVSVG